MEDINREIDSDSDSGSDSMMTESDDIDFSDIESIPSTIFSNPLKETPKRQTPKRNTPTEKKSRIPVRSKTRFDEMKPVIQEQEFKKPQNNYPSIQLSEQAGKSKPRVEKVINFLAVDFTKYSHCLVCVYKGTGFPKMRNGERSTYVVVKLHEKLAEDITPVCWRKTNNAQYNAGYKHDISTLSFDGTTPHIEVFDMHIDNTYEFLGMGFIQLQMAKIVGNVCIVCKDEWIPIFMEESDSERGKVLMTVIFYNNEEDIVGMIRNPAEEVDDENPVKQQAVTSVQQTQPQNVAPQQKQKTEEAAPLKSSAAVQADTGVDAYVTDDPLISTAEDFVLKYDKPKAWRELSDIEKPQKTINQQEIDEESSSFITRKEYIKKKKPKMVFMDASDLDLDTTQPIAPPPPTYVRQPQKPQPIPQPQKQQTKYDDEFASSSSSFLGQEQERPAFKTRRRSKKNDQNQPPKQAMEQQKPFNIVDDDPLKYNIFANQIRSFNQKL